MGRVCAEGTARSLVMLFSVVLETAVQKAACVFCTAL